MPLLFPGNSVCCSRGTVFAVSSSDFCCLQFRFLLFPVPRFCRKKTKFFPQKTSIRTSPRQLSGQLPDSYLGSSQTAIWASKKTTLTLRPRKPCVRGSEGSSSLVFEGPRALPRASHAKARHVRARKRTTLFSSKPSVSLRAHKFCGPRQPRAPRESKLRSTRGVASDAPPNAPPLQISQIRFCVILGGRGAPRRGSYKKCLPRKPRVLS